MREFALIAFGYIGIKIIKAFRYIDYTKKNTYLISSSPRSGSTWLSEVMRSIPGSCVVFEPLHLRHVPEAKDAGFDWHTYRDKEDHWPEGKRFFKLVFRGKIVNKWTNRENSLSRSLLPKNYVVKCVRTNRLLPWICNNLNINPPILLLRHPCAVVASQLKSKVWQRGGKPDTPEYLQGYPLFKELISGLSCMEEYLAANWAMDQLPALMQPHPHNWVIITYEELVSDPEIAYRRLFKRLNIDIESRDIYTRTNQPSTVVYESGISGIDGWVKQLSQEQIDKILSVTQSFGLTFYNKSKLPNLEILGGEKLHLDIKQCGSK